MSINIAARLGALLFAGLLTACSGDDGRDAADPSIEAPDGSTSAAPPGDDPAPAEPAGETAATVTVAGATYEFIDDGGARNFCSLVGPSLQASLVTADGEGELSLFLIQSDANLSGDLAADNQPYVDLEVAGQKYTAGESSLASVVDTVPVELSVSGKTASGTVTMTSVLNSEKVDAQLELTCA